jgi:hypothetical protein
MNSYSSIGLSTAQLPLEGPKTVPLVLDFTQQASYTVDLQNLQGRNFLSSVQAVYVDNSNNAAGLTLTFDGTQQAVICKGRTQGYYTVLATNPVRFTAASAGAVIVRLYLLNVPVAGAVWATQ